MNLDATELEIPGCYSATTRKVSDLRGSFTKLFHAKASDFYLKGFRPREIYITESTAGVLRGMHFQLPPDDHSKVVVCLAGEVLDVILDLRAGPGYGSVKSLQLGRRGANIVLLPPGVAHGFYVNSETATLAYLVETEYSPKKDSGILWSSIDFDWPTVKPILSERDMAFPALEAFRPPLEW